MGVWRISTIKTIWQGLNWSYLVEMLISVVPALLCITFHELCHGLVAYKLGDDTAKRAGRLTLNPLKHIDVMGLAMMVIFHFGWAKPVPVDMRKFKNPKRGMAITALAGPVSNLLLSVLFMALYGALFLPLAGRGAVGETVLSMLSMTAYLSLGFAVFNIFPIPPMDGSKVLGALLSDQAYYKLMQYERYGMILLLLLVSTGVLGRPLGAATAFLYDKLIVIAQAIYDLELALI